MGTMPLHSKLNPIASEFRPSTLTTTTHQPPPPAPQNHHLYYYYHFFLPYDLHNPPAAAATTPFLPSPGYYYVNTFTSPDISLSCSPPSSPPPTATTDQTFLPYYVTAFTSQDTATSRPPPSYPPPPASVISTDITISYPPQSYPPPPATTDQTCLPYPSYYYVTTSTSQDIATSCPPPSYPSPPATTDQTFLPSASYYYVTTSTSQDIANSCPPPSYPPPPPTTDQTSLPSPSYYYITSSTSHDITPFCPSPSSPPPLVTMDQTSEEQIRLDTTARTRGGYRKRRGGRRGGFVPPRVWQQWRAPQATVSRVKGNGGGSGGCDRGTRRIRGIVRDGKYEVLKLEPDDSSTTVMIKNIPSRYTRELLMEFLDKHCMTMNDEAGSDSTEKFISAYDFLYLPVDFEEKANKGYAFVNFTDPKAAWRFFETSNGQSWDHFHSSKIRQIVSARLQGKERLVKHFRGSAFRCESDDYLPVCFSPARDGSAGQEVEQTTVGNRVW